MPTSNPTQRISALSNHLDTSALAPTMSTTTTATKPPVTCHVLDTTLGRPASSIPVTLTLYNPPSTTTSSSQPLKFSGTTNADGRVTSWTPSSPFSSASLEEVFKQGGGDSDQKYGLTFDTEEYFGARGVKTFFPEVEVKFVCRGEERAKGEHFHVPVLVGGFGYTTYRGS